MSARHPVIAELELSPRLAPDAVPDLATSALARFPDDTEVVEAAVHALDAVGRKDLARSAADAAIARKPTSRRLARLRARLGD